MNRMILGDSLVVMNSLLHYEGLGGQVQMIYIDPPYGVKFGSNFQPFVRKRDVTHNDDEDMTREPEMVKAYRDTWELGLHSYLTYMRDRLLLGARTAHSHAGAYSCRSATRISTTFAKLMDEVFGAENFSRSITFRRRQVPESSILPATSAIIFFGTRKDQDRMKYNQRLVKREPVENPAER